MNQQRIGDVAATLLDFVEQNKTYQTAKMMTVPAASYLDPEVWTAEKERIFKRLPLMLALSCEMPKPGDYKATEVVGVPVLIARDKAGAVRAFFNVCAHRWAPVAAQGHGHCARFRFTCPFHGWTYGADGKLMGVADRAKFGEIDQAKHGLKELPCEERHGMIFVCLTPGAPLQLEEYYGALLAEYAEFGFQDWSYLGSTVIDGPNWKLLWTNFFESYHFATQHPKTVSQRWVPNVIHYEGFGPNMRVGFALRPIAKLREVPREDWSQQEGRCFTFMRYFFPNVIGSLNPYDTSLFTEVLPGPTPDRSRVVIKFVRKEAPKDDADRERIAMELRRVTEEDPTLRDEDFATALAVQRGLDSGAHAGLLYGHNERGPQYFHEWVDWYLSGNPNAPKPIL